MSFCLSEKQRRMEVTRNKMNQFKDVTIQINKEINHQHDVIRNIVIILYFCSKLPRALPSEMKSQEWGRFTPI